MADNYYITLEIHDEGEWPRIAPENLMQHVDMRLPSGLTLAGAKVTETAKACNSHDALVGVAQKIVDRYAGNFAVPFAEAELLDAAQDALALAQGETS